MIVHLNAGRNVRDPWVRQVAYHEAGHAVVGTIYRLAVVRASIIADAAADILGFVEYTESSQRAAPVDVHIATLLAGQAAQDHASYVLGLPIFHADSNDHVRARSLVARQLGIDDWLDPSVDFRMASARDCAAQAVHYHWRWIDRVARALAARKTLDGAEIVGLK